MSHSFEEKTFTHLTYCDHCKQLLWGVLKQGLQCKGCGYTCHRKCIDLAPKCSSAAPARFLDDTNNSSTTHTDKSNKNSRAEKYLRQLKQRAGSEDISVAGSSSSASSSASASSSVKLKASTATATKEAPGNSKQKEEIGTLHHLYEIITSDKFQTMVADAATNQEEPVCAYLDNQAALNPQITAKNFTRFVSRCGPVYSFRDRLLLLLSWDNRVDSFISLLVYCLICLYPKLLFLIPQMILVYLITSSQSRKGKKQDTQKPSQKKKDDQSKKKDKPAALEDEKKKSPIMDKSSSSTTKSAATVETPSLFNLSTTLLQLGPDQSPEYLKNLQNIQNTMGEFSDAYDWIVMQYSNHLNWSSEEETSYILQAIIVFTVLLSPMIYFVPVNIIFLCFGPIIYSGNTRFAKYLIRELKPYLGQWTKSQADIVKHKYVDLESNLKIQESTKEVSVYENQRWWLNRGYLHEMSEDERSPWSDYGGTLYLPIITEVPAPKGYEWKETSEWKLDTKGPWVNDYLGFAPDKDGWVYSDGDWNIKMMNIEPEEDFNKYQHQEAMTRRRRWTRECEVA